MFEITTQRWEDGQVINAVPYLNSKDLDGLYEFYKSRIKK